MKIHHEYEDLAIVCANCERPFLWTAEDQEERLRRKRGARTHCVLCEFKRIYPNIHTLYDRHGAEGLPYPIRRKLEQAPMISEVQEYSPSTTLPNSSAEQLLGEACRLVDEAYSIEAKEPEGFFEALFGPDPQVEARKQRKRTLARARAMINDKLKLAMDTHGLVAAARELKREELEANAEVLELQNVVVQKQMALGQSVERHRLAAGRRTKGFLPGTASEAEEAVSTHRRSLRSQASAKRGALSDLIEAAQDAFDSDATDEQKCAEITQLLDTYQQPETVLPKRIQRFLSYMDHDGD